MLNGELTPIFNTYGKGEVEEDWDWNGKIRGGEGVGITLRTYSIKSTGL